METGKQLIRFVCDKSQSIQLIYQFSTAEQNSRRQACCLAFFGSPVYQLR